MEKLAMCRICLVQNVRMHLVVNRNFHELYEKLTYIPFITEDRRPILVCFFCCAKLKKCCQLMRKCLEAEKLFAQIMNEDYEPKPLINLDHLEYLGGFIKSPTENISIVDVVQTESIAIKEELPAVCEGLDDVSEPKEEHQRDELELENLDNRCLDVADIPPHHSESDLEEDVPLIEFKTKVDEEQEVCKKKRKARVTKKLKLENLDNSCLDVADTPPHHNESDLEGDVPLMEFKIEVEEEQEISKKKRIARETKRATVAKKLKLDTRIIKLEDALTAEQTKEKSDLKVIPITHPDKKLKCDLGQRNISEKSLLTEHTRIHTSEKPYKCDVCLRSFSLKTRLTHHIRIHTGEKPYKCDVCQRSFSQKGNLTLHIRRHTGEKSYKCDVCLRSFSRNTHLTQHIRIHSGEKPYKCNLCLRSFSLKTHLTHHIRIHTGENPYKCDVCLRSFSQKGHLTQHSRIHTGEKPYKCDVCLHSFSQKGHLKLHILIHTGEKPYKCDVCQLSFVQKSNFIKHFRIHTGDKPYKCDICPRSYHDRDTLTKHNRIHTGEKPYKCDVCQRSFREKGHLSQHSRIHTGDKPYKCDVCQRSFSHKCYLKTHSYTHW